MGEEKLLTVRDVSLILGVSEKEVLDLAESGLLPAYKVGGVYLRFKRDQVEDYLRRKKQANPAIPEKKISIKDNLSDFLYFNDFYILAILIIGFLLFIIFGRQ
jgi:excisionase family DNA binding protein